MSRAKYSLYFVRIILSISYTYPLHVCVLRLSFGLFIIDRILIYLPRVQFCHIWLQDELLLFYVFQFYFNFPSWIDVLESQKCQSFYFSAVM